MIQDPVPLQTDSANQMDQLLKTKVLRKTARILNLDDTSLCDLLSLRAHQSSISITDFSSALEVGLEGDTSGAGEVTLTGYALVEHKPVGHNKRVGNTVRLGGLQTQGRGNAYERLWKAHHMHPCQSRDTTLTNATQPSRQTLRTALECLQYQTGSAWLSDERYVAKGFAVMVNFTCGWNSLMRCLVPGHPLMEYLAVKWKHHQHSSARYDDGGDPLESDVHDDDISVLSAEESESRRGAGALDIPLGCVSWVVYGGGALSRMNQRQQQHSVDKQMVLGMDAQGSVSVGVSFHGNDESTSLSHH